MELTWQNKVDYSEYVSRKPFIINNRLYKLILFLIVLTLGRVC
jgi:hypothetical protein